MRSLFEKVKHLMVEALSVGVLLVSWYLLKNIMPESGTFQCILPAALAALFSTGAAASTGPATALSAAGAGAGGVGAGLATAGGAGAGGLSSFFGGGGGLGGGGGGGGGLGNILQFISKLNPSFQSKHFSFGGPQADRDQLLERLFQILEGPQTRNQPFGNQSANPIVFVGGQNRPEAITPMGGGGLNLNQPIGSLSRFFRP